MGMMKASHVEYPLQYLRIWAVGGPSLREMTTCWSEKWKMEAQFLQLYR